MINLIFHFCAGLLIITTTLCAMAVLIVAAIRTVIDRCLIIAKTVEEWEEWKKLFKI